MKDKNYYYLLQYINDDTTVEYKFSAYITSEKLVEQLKYFLLASGWSEYQIKEMFNEYDEEVEDDEIHN